MNKIQQYLFQGMTVLFLSLSWGSLPSFAQEEGDYQKLIEEAMEIIQDSRQEYEDNEGGQIQINSKPGKGDIDHLTDIPNEGKALTYKEFNQTVLEQEKLDGKDPLKSKRYIDEIDVTNMDLQDVLRVISYKSGVTIIPDEDIAGKVTTYLKNIEVRDALRVVLQDNNAAFSEEDNYIRVMSAQEFENIYGYRFGIRKHVKNIQLKHVKTSDLKEILNPMRSDDGNIIYNEQKNSIVLVDVPDNVELMMSLINRLDVPILSKKFSFTYADAQEISEKLEKVITSGIGHIETDITTNQVTVTDTEAKLAEIEVFIKEQDQENITILIETQIIQIVLNDEHMDGIDWEAIVSDYKRIDFKGFHDSYPDGKVEESKGLSIGTASAEDYQVLLEALDTVGTIKQVSTNKFITENKRGVDLLIKGKELNMMDEDDRDSNNTTDEDFMMLLKPLNKGVKKITLDILPIIQLDQDQIYLGKNATIFNDKKSEIIPVDLEPGNTVVMGSLFKKVRIDSVRKIPLLGDLPLLGFAFRNEGKKVRNTEIIIFITPKIVKNT